MTFCPQEMKHLISVLLESLFQNETEQGLSLHKCFNLYCGFYEHLLCIFTSATLEPISLFSRVHGDHFDVVGLAGSQLYCLKCTPLLFISNKTHRLHGRIASLCGQSQFQRKLHGSVIIRWTEMMVPKGREGQKEKKRMPFCGFCPPKRKHSLSMLSESLFQRQTRRDGETYRFISFFQSPLYLV